jgi:uncharacterized heparinase superfamily protein
LLPEVLLVVWRKTSKPLRVWRRRSWLYRRLLLGGPLSDRVKFEPYDASPRRLEDADALLRGRFRLAGHILEVSDGSVFDKPAPSPAWHEGMHAFAWLPPLAAAGGDPARTLATNLLSQWLKRHARYSEPAWSPQVLARRLINLICHARIIFANSDVMWRSKVFVSLREQSRMLARIAREAPEGMARLEVATAVALSGVCLDQADAHLAFGLKFLGQECDRQILPDGGHVSRSPDALLRAYGLITMVLDALTATGHHVPQSLRATHDRIAPMLRFFRHGDGALALFNGGHECDQRMIASLLARDEVRGQPFGYARHSGYDRIALAKTLVVVDCGAPPPLAFARRAHAGCLSFEFSASGQRIVVNCGAGGVGHEKWGDVLAATAAHSTMTLSDTSSGSLLADGSFRRLVGTRLISGPRNVTTNRTEGTSGVTVDASHDAYLEQFGVVHERCMTLAPQGMMLTGVDRLVPHVQGKRRESIPFAVRFHIHPDVRLSLSQGGDILLKLPNGDGWRFRAGGGQLMTEESVYLGNDAVRRSEQLVITGAVKDTPTEVAWAFEHIGSL